MTSIYNIPYKDIVEFLLANNIDFEDENQAYNIARNLLKDKKAIGHTISIIEWMMAHNLLIRKVSVSIYTTYEIDNMSQIEIKRLAKLLKMKGNNVVNIKNILRYLHKLDEENITLLPEINDIILQNFNELEIENINFENLGLYSVIDLLKTHRNKALIRKMIYNNMEKIVLYNVLIYNHTIKEINNLIENLYDEEIYIHRENLKHFIDDFLINLIKIKEVGLAKKVFDIANKYKFITATDGVYFSFNKYFILTLVDQKNDINIFNKLLGFMGEDNFINDFYDIIVNYSDTFSVKQLFNMLIKLEKYDLLRKILDILSFTNYESNQVINTMLPRIKKAIELKKQILL